MTAPILPSARSAQLPLNRTDADKTLAQPAAPPQAKSLLSVPTSRGSKDIQLAKTQLGSRKFHSPEEREKAVARATIEVELDRMFDTQTATMAFVDAKWLREKNARRHESKEVKHARMLVTIAQDQESAGVHEPGMLTAAEARARYDALLAEKQKPFYQRTFEYVTGKLSFPLGAEAALIGGQPDGICAADGNCAAPVPTPAAAKWLKSLDAFEKTAKNGFVLRKSANLEPGEPPQVIVIGDSHFEPGVQVDVTKLVGLVHDPKAGGLLFVEWRHDTSPPKSRCFGFDAATGCIGIDSPEELDSWFKYEKASVEAAFDCARFAISKVPKHIKSTLPSLPSDIYQQSYMESWDRCAEIFTAAMPHLTAKSKAKLDKLIVAFQESQTTFGTHAMINSGPKREAYMLERLAEYVKPGHVYVFVVGNTHRANIEEIILEKYKSWSLASKR
jgi:hypothetical protein